MIQQSNNLEQPFKAFKCTLMIECKDSGDPLHDYKETHKPTGQSEMSIAHAHI